MLKRHKAAMAKERIGNDASIALKDSLLATKTAKIKQLKAAVERLLTLHRASTSELKTAHDTQVKELKSDHNTKMRDLKALCSRRELVVMIKHKAKHLKLSDIIRCKSDSIAKLKCESVRKICEMDDWMAEVNEERESAISLLIKSKEKLLASKNAANALKVKLNRKEDKLLEHQRSSATLQRRCEQLERSLVELDMEKLEYIAELEHNCTQAIEELNSSTCYMASFNLHFMLSKSCLYQFFNRN